MKRRAAHRANHERWLVSYADFITLLFAFFVVLYASSQADMKKRKQVADAVKEAFSEMGAFDPGSRTLSISNAGGESTAGEPAVIPMPLPSEQTIEELKQTIDRILTEQVAQGHLGRGSVTTRITPDGLVISLNDAGFFASGSAEVTPSSLHTLSTIIDAMPNRPVRIEGHTDNVPIHTAQFATNWELSTARASAIARLILERGTIDAAKISAAGYAEFHPVATNDTEAGRTQNRRVDIILLRTTASGQALSQ
jgi:chemotaxis protein MotB